MKSDLAPTAQQKVAVDDLSRSWQMPVAVGTILPGGNRKGWLPVRLADGTRLYVKPDGRTVWGPSIWEGDVPDEPSPAA